MSWLLTVGLVIVSLVALARARASLPVLGLVFAGVLLVLTLGGLLPGVAAAALWTLLLVGALLGVSPLRRRLLSAPLLEQVRHKLPPMSDTERTALDAGTVGWEAELFRGNPDWQRLLQVPAPALTAEEQAFLSGPVEELCGMLDDWQINRDGDLPPPVWDFLKRHRFFGLIIPTEYGGRGFSHLAHSQVVMKVCSRSGTTGVTVMVPNSLGPAELLLSYGTDEQKQYYLPRLARGEEIPCFALTGPDAGSDASSIPDYGVVCNGRHGGREVLGLRLNWEKRYITLGPVATLLGLAFKVYDPDHLLGEREELGITCALIPTKTRGVNIGDRHLPIGAAFQNGPNSGKDVFIPMEWVIGGQARVGDGWRMLMESLSAGRGISLPALGVASGKLASRMTGAYARVRRQFRSPIGRFEGVEEALARIGGLTYLMDSARRLALAALHQGEKPSVVSAIIKYNLTEGMRQVINDAMDVHGGRGVCMGPSNYVAPAYQSMPIAITVEGANILTRSMIIFGQGAMRCHPYLLEEISAASRTDREAAVRGFDAALAGHLSYLIRNLARSVVYGLSGARLAPAPTSGPEAAYYRQLARASAAFALVSDFALLILGGALKRREKLSGRFADALSQLYLCSAVLKRFEDTGKPAADLPLVHWACAHTLYRVQVALDEILRNFPLSWLGAMLRVMVFPLGRTLAPPKDELGHEIAQLLLAPSEARDRLTEGVYVSAEPDDPMGRVEHAMHAAIAAWPVERKLKKTGLQAPPMEEYAQWLERLVADGTLQTAEAQLLEHAALATREAINVDAFAPLAVGRGAEKAA